MEHNLQNIIIDIDGVIAAYDFPMLTEKYFGVRVEDKDINFYSIEDSLGVPGSEVIAMFSKEVHAPPNFVPGAKKALETLMDKYHINILSARLNWMTQEELADWLDEHNVPYHDVINGGDLPSYVHAHIDDSPTKLLKVAEMTTVKHSILFGCAWNRFCLNIQNRLTRAKNWKAVLEVINGK